MWPVTPTPDESLLSWVVRTADHNVLPSCYTLLRSAGSQYNDKPFVAIMRLDGVSALASVLGGKPEQVGKRMLQPAVCPSFVDVNGVLIRTISLVTNRRRFSPATLRDCNAHLTTWMIRTLPFCPKSWEYLQDTCRECGTIQAWRNAEDMRRCDKCCADLTEQHADVVDRYLREPLAVLAAVVTGDAARLVEARRTLPDALQTLDAGELLELTITIAGLVDVDLPNWLGANAGLVDHQAITAGTAAAWRLLEQYPTSIVDALWNAKTTLDDKRRARFTRRLAAILRGDDRLNVLPGVRTALGVLHRLIAGSDGDGRNLLVKPAARLLGVTETEIAEARDDGSLGRCNGMSNGRILFNLDRDEVERLADVRRHRLSPSAIGKRAGIPPYAVRQLTRAKILGVQDHPWLTRTYGGAQVTEADVADLELRLRQLAVSSQVISRPIRLATVMRGYGGGIKPWAAVFRRLLRMGADGSDGASAIAFAFHEDYREIIISTEDAKDCWSIEPVVPDDEYSQLDGTDILNHPLKRACALKRFRTGKGGHRKWLLSGPQMAIVAAERMAFGELTVRTGLTTVVLRNLLLARHVEKPNEFGWLREQVLDRAADVVWRPILA